MTLDIKKGPGQVYNPLPVRIYMSGLEPRQKKGVLFGIFVQT